MYRFTRRIKKAARAVKQKESELASVVQESISSVRVVKAFAREDFEESRLDRQSQESVALSLRARSIKARLPPLVDVIVAIGTCLVLWFGVRLVLEGRLTSGALLVFILYLGKMYKPMKDLSKMADTLSKAAVGFERIAEILNIERQVRDRPGARPAPPFKGRIEFAHVRFGYAPEQTVLNDVSLLVAARTARRARRPDRQWQVHADRADPPALRHAGWPDLDRRPGRPQLHPGLTPAAGQLRPAGSRAVPHDGGPEHRVWQAGGDPGRHRSRGHAGECATSSSRAFRRATTR